MDILKLNFIKLIAALCGVMVLLVVLSMGLASPAKAAEAPLEVPVSINALMVTLIDHSAHYIWDYGVMERDITDEEWRTVEYYAIQLAGSGPLITLGGTGAMDDAWAESPLWVEYSRQMTNAAVMALNASRSQDKGLLASVGDVLVASCEGCHNVFKPNLPTEGITHMPDYDYLYHIFR
jgi:hypothetical protein